MHKGNLFCRYKRTCLFVGKDRKDGGGAVNKIEKYKLHWT